MKFFSSVGIGLSGVFCCLLLALMAETYYLLWFKRSITSTDQIQEEAKKKKKQSSLMVPTATAQTSCEPRITEDRLHSNSIEDLYLKAIDESCMEAGLMMGPPRLLFTIKEETKEDLESEECRVKGVSRRLSDLIMSSPSFFTPPLTPSMGSSHRHSCYNPFNESSTDVEFNLIRPSPPPKFKFLRDAEEKLLNRSNLMA